MRSPLVVCFAKPRDLDFSPLDLTSYRCHAEPVHQIWAFYDSATSVIELEARTGIRDRRTDRRTDWKCNAAF